MSKQLKVILLILLAVFIIIQFIPSNRPDNNPVVGYDFFEQYDVPQEVELILRTACFDCHSQEVNYPWYSYVAPVSWQVSQDVRMGRAHLDFSLWNELEKKEKIKIATEIGEEVEIGVMPMAIYVFMHSEAELGPGDKQLIVEWSEALAEKVFED